MASTIKSTRIAAGISVNDLATRLGVTPSAISQLERSEFEGTIKLNSLREALSALGANLRITAGTESRMSKYSPYRVADSMAETLLSKRDTTFALRLLTHATKELSDNSDQFDPSEIDLAPTPLPDKGWDTLMRAEFARAIPERKRPAWTKTTKLAEPWFVSEFPVLREKAKTRTPAYLRRLNIFIDERSLSRI
ncbi:MAG TPA: helix-turn-helix domain-containing protein [Galbitalea sp.]|nr:helix-turn-helix domain-containing protein [Galbitalea sp.]